MLWIVHVSVVEEWVMEASFLSQASALKQKGALSHWQAVMKWPLGQVTGSHDGWDGAVCLAVAPVPCQKSDTPLLRCFLVTQPSLVLTLLNISKGFIHTTGQTHVTDLFNSSSYSCSILHFVHEMYLCALCCAGLKWRKIKKQKSKNNHLWGFTGSFTVKCYI